MDQKEEFQARRRSRKSVSKAVTILQQTLPVGSFEPGYDAFAEIVPCLDTVGCDLARPALLIAADENPGLNIQRYMLMLDDLADDALHNVVLDATTECDGARRLALYLANHRGFCGNIDNYYDPRNSFLSDVLDRHVGIPITLSLVLMEVGRRLGLPLVGIGFPGHFMVGCGPYKRNEYLLIDQFCNGKVVNWSECEMRLQALGMEFDPDKHLMPVSNRSFMIRLLNNLKSSYVQRRDIPKALRAIDRIALLDSSIIDEYKKLGMTLADEGSYASSRLCLRSYLEHRSVGEGADFVRGLISRLNNIRAERN
jgi:regulator of sirC expression with transglutaminase-like and TPR domain